MVCNQDKICAGTPLRFFVAVALIIAGAAGNIFDCVFMVVF